MEHTINISEELKQQRQMILDEINGKREMLQKAIESLTFHRNNTRNLEKEIYDLQQDTGSVPQKIIDKRDTEHHYARFREFLANRLIIEIKGCETMIVNGGWNHIHSDNNIEYLLK